MLKRKNSVPGYSPLVTKRDHLNCYGRGLGVYIKDGFSCGTDTTDEDLDFIFMCFSVIFVNNSCFIFNFYCPQDNGDYGDD